MLSGEEGDGGAVHAAFGLIVVLGIAGLVIFLVHQTAGLLASAIATIALGTAVFAVISWFRTTGKGGVKIKR